MKICLFITLFCTAYTGIAQVQPYYSLFRVQKPEKEVAIVEPPVTQGPTSFHITSTYNDIFKEDANNARFLLPEPDYYKQKKVAQVQITDKAGRMQFVLDLSPAGLATKITQGQNIVRKEQMYYNESGSNYMTVTRFNKGSNVVKVDTIRYSRQKKVVNDTIYQYTLINKSSYKSGRFLNEQNSYYNQKYFNTKMTDATSLWISPFDKGVDTTYLARKFACNYNPDQFYFSREYVDVEDWEITFHQKPIQPGGEELTRYIRELLRRLKSKYSDLPCEQFEEPRFTEQTFICGTGIRGAHEYNLLQMRTYYTYSHNSNGLQDTCYLNVAGNKKPCYYFTYSYFN